MPVIDEKTNSESWTVPRMENGERKGDNWYACANPRTSLGAPHSNELDALVDLRTQLRDITGKVDLRIDELLKARALGVSADPRVVSGARCVWWGSISEVKTVKVPAVIAHGLDLPAGELPCCPHCGGVLFEWPDQAAWFESVDKHEARGGADGYRAVIEWMRGKHFNTWAEAQAAYDAENGAGDGRAG